MPHITDELRSQTLITKTSGASSGSGQPPSDEPGNELPLNLVNFECELSRIDRNLIDVVEQLSMILESLAPLGFTLDSFLKERTELLDGMIEARTLPRLMNTASLLRMSTDALTRFVEVLRNRVVVPKLHPDDHEPWEKS